jgi:hypothetical protein
MLLKPIEESAPSAARAKKRETVPMHARVMELCMAGRHNYLPRCGALTRRGTFCLAKPVLNPDGSIRNGRCRNHAGCSTGPRTVAGHARCLAGRLELYRRRRAAGLPAINRRPKVAPAASTSPPKWTWTESPEGRRQRVLEMLRIRYPEGGF